MECNIEVHGVEYVIIENNGFDEDNQCHCVKVSYEDGARLVVKYGDGDWQWVQPVQANDSPVGCIQVEEESKEAIQPETIKVYGVEYSVLGGMERNPKDNSITVLVDKGQDEEGRQLVQLAMHNNITGEWEWHGPVEEQVPDLLPIKRTISVWEPGAMVKLVDELEGRIRAVQIRMDGSVSYEIAWWKDHNRSIAWMNEGEFKVIESGDKCQIGFVKEE